MKKLCIMLLLVTIGLLACDEEKSSSPNPFTPSPFVTEGALTDTSSVNNVSTPNRRPVVTSWCSLDAGTLLFNARYSDPDGDTVRVIRAHSKSSLDVPVPDGTMELLNESVGESYYRWTPPEGFSGLVWLRIEVEDEHGAKASDISDCEIPPIDQECVAGCEPPPVCTVNCGPPPPPPPACPNVVYTGPSSVTLENSNPETELALAQSVSPGVQRIESGPASVVLVKAGRETYIFTNVGEEGFLFDVPQDISHISYFRCPND